MDVEDEVPGPVRRGLDAVRAGLVGPVPGRFETRDRAARAHATQLGPDNPFFAHPREIEREVWPTEDDQLAKSVVPTTVPEDDLFAGVRGSSAAGA
ncbi:hypothetical protein GCM10023108_28020 [Saccharopolyspora hordei]